MLVQGLALFAAVAAPVPEDHQVTGNSVQHHQRIRKYKNPVIDEPTVYGKSERRGNLPGEKPARYTFGVTGGPLLMDLFGNRQKEDDGTCPPDDIRDILHDC